MCRLFEGVILLGLGFQGRIEHSNSPGDIADFRIKAKHEVQLWVDGNRPDDAGHLWGNPILRIRPEAPQYQLRFVRFFDWDELGIRHLRFMEVLIQAMDDHPNLVGHHALMELEGCSIYFMHPGEQGT